MDLIWRDLAENQERCRRLQLYSETDPGTAATFAVRCNDIIGVTSEENFANDAMYLVEGVFPDNHTLQTVEIHWSFLQNLQLDERLALLQGVASIPSMQHISIRGGCSNSNAVTVPPAAPDEGGDESDETTTFLSTSLPPHVSVLNFSLFTLVAERAHATLTSLSIEVCELKISNFNDLKNAADSLAQCTQLESLHMRGLSLQQQTTANNNHATTTGRGGNNNNNGDDDNDEESVHNNGIDISQQQQPQQHQQQHAGAGGGCYDVLLQALATLPKLRVLHLSQKEDPNKSSSPTTAATTAIETIENSTTTDASSSSLEQQQQQQQASSSSSTIACDALAAFCRAALPRLTCLSLLNMGLQDAHCAVLQHELHHSTTLTSLILIDNPAITETGNSMLLQLLQQNRSIFNSTFGTDSDTQYRAQQLTLLHMNRCGRSRYKVSADDDDDDSNAADDDSSTSNTSRHRGRPAVKPLVQQQRPEQAWLSYLTKINETVPEELELDALYCAISENPDMIRHACCACCPAATAAVAALMEEESNGGNHHEGGELEAQKNKSPVEAAATTTPSFILQQEPAIPSTITTKTHHHHHHHHHQQHHLSCSPLKKNEIAAIGLVEQGLDIDKDKDKDDDDEDEDDKPVLDEDTPTESNCSSAGLVSDLSSCGVEDNQDGDDDVNLESHEETAKDDQDDEDVVVVVVAIMDKDNGQDDDVYMNQFRRLESKLAQRERQLWMREQALQARMRRVLNREADLRQAEARIKAMREHSLKNTNNNNKNTNCSASCLRPLEYEEHQQQQGLLFPSFSTGGTLYYKSQHRVKSSQKTKASQHHQAESEYCETTAKTMTKKDSSLTVSRTSSLQPQDSLSSLEGRDDVHQQPQQHDAGNAPDAVVLNGHGAAARSLHPGTTTTTAAAAAAALPCLFMMATSSSQSVSSLLLDLEKQTTSTLEHVRDECWNLSMTSFFSIA